MGFLDYFSREEYVEYTESDKTNILGLSKMRVEHLKNMAVEIYHDNYANYKREVKIINSDDIIGSTRFTMYGNWYDMLVKDCHKQRNFEIFDITIFDEVLMCETSEDVPSVVEVNGQYYIAGSGKHRLTFAKCLGNRQVIVVVYHA